MHVVVIACGNLERHPSRGCRGDVSSARHRAGTIGPARLGRPAAGVRPRGNSPALDPGQRTHVVTASATREHSVSSPWRPVLAGRRGWRTRTVQNPTPRAPRNAQATPQRRRQATLARRRRAIRPATSRKTRAAPGAGGDRFDPLHRQWPCPTKKTTRTSRSRLKRSSPLKAHQSSGGGARAIGPTRTRHRGEAAAKGTDPRECGTCPRPWAPGGRLACGQSLPLARLASVRACRAAQRPERTNLAARPSMFAPRQRGERRAPWAGGAGAASRDQARAEPFGAFLRQLQRLPRAGTSGSGPSRWLGTSSSVWVGL